MIDDKLPYNFKVGVMNVVTVYIYGLIYCLILFREWFSKALVHLLLMIMAANRSWGLLNEEGVIFYGLSSDLKGSESWWDLEFSYED